MKKKSIFFNLTPNEKINFIAKTINELTVKQQDRLFILLCSDKNSFHKRFLGIELKKI